MNALGRRGGGGVFAVLNSSVAPHAVVIVVVAAIVMDGRSRKRVKIVGKSHRVFLLGATREKENRCERVALWSAI